MIWHNLKFIIRRIFNEKFFYGINIFGLVIGIFSFLVLFVYVANEKSFDKIVIDFFSISLPPFETLKFAEVFDKKAKN
jgi:hypothetical protein